MGSHPMRRHGNRIGGHKKRSFLYGTVRPRVNSECGIIYNPRPLAFEACLKRLALTQQVSMPWNRHHGTKAIKIKMIRNSVSTSPGTDQFTRLGNRLVLCTAGSPQYGQLSVAMGSIARACKRLHPLRKLSLRTGVTEQSEAGKSVGAHPLHRLVWQYMSIISSVYTYTF
jgi:hypothetical protein